MTLPLLLKVLCGLPAVVRAGSVFFILNCGFCGCVSVSQTSAKIAETGRVYYFADPAGAVAAYSRDSRIFLKCPVSAFEKQYSYVRGAVPMAYFGGFRYVELETDAENVPAANETEYVFVVADAEANADSESAFGGAGLFSVCGELTERDFAPEEEIPVPETVRSRARFFPRFCGTPEQMRPLMPLVREERNLLHAFLVPVAVLDGIAVDFPLSVIMTLTGTVWYIPLGDAF